MYDQSYEQYMQEVLGYNCQSPTYSRNQYDIYDNDMYNTLPSNKYMQNTLNEQLEKYYPEIYKIVYPMVCKICNEIAEPVTEEMIETMTNTIYMNVEGADNSTVNIKIQQSRNLDAKNSTNKEQRETRTQNFMLRDLIKILIINRLINNRPQFLPPRPPFQGSKPRNIIHQTDYNGYIF